MATKISPLRPKTEEDIAFDQRKSFDSVQAPTFEEATEGFSPLRKRVGQFGTSLGQAGLESPLVGAAKVGEFLGVPGFPKGIAEGLSEEFAGDFPRRSEETDALGKGLELAGSGIGSVARSLGAVINPALTAPVLGSFFMEAAGQSLRDTEGQDLNTTERVGLALAEATTEFIFEGLQLKFLPREVQGFVKKGLIAAVQGGVEEPLTTVTQNIIKNYYREQGITEGLLDSAIAGAIGGTVLAPFAKPTEKGVTLDTDETDLTDAMDLPEEQDPRIQEVNAVLKAENPPLTPGVTDRQRLQNTVIELTTSGVDRNAIRAEAALARKMNLTMDQFSTRLKTRFANQRNVKDIRADAKKNIQEFNRVLNASLTAPKLKPEEIAKQTGVSENRVRNILNFGKNPSLDIKTLSEGTIDKMEREEVSDLFNLTSIVAEASTFNPRNPDNVAVILEKLEQIDAIENGKVRFKIKDPAKFYASIMKDPKAQEQFFNNPVVLSALRNAGFNSIAVRVKDGKRVKPATKYITNEDTLEFQIPNIIAAVSSPFPEYDQNYMGSGEGSQAFGYGWYSSENFPLVMNVYMKIMQRKSVPTIKLRNGKSLPLSKDNMERLNEYLKNSGRGREDDDVNYRTQRYLVVRQSDLELMVQDRASERTVTEETKKLKEELEEINKALEEIETSGLGAPERRGYLNKLTLFKDSETGPEDLIQYYHPLKNQTKGVYEGIKKTISEMFGIDINNQKATSTDESFLNAITIENAHFMLEYINQEALIPKIPSPPFVKAGRNLGFNLNQIQIAFKAIKDVIKSNNIDLINNSNAKADIKKALGRSEIYVIDPMATKLIEGNITWGDLRHQVVQKLQTEKGMTKRDAEKHLSLSLAENGVLGVRYPPGTLLANADRLQADKYHFVVFRDRDMTIEKQMEFLENDTYVIDEEKGVGRVREDEIEFQTSNQGDINPITAKLYQAVGLADDIDDISFISPDGFNIGGKIDEQLGPIAHMDVADKIDANETDLVNQGFIRVSTPESGVMEDNTIFMRVKSNNVSFDTLMRMESFLEQAIDRYPTAEQELWVGSKRLRNHKELRRALKTVFNLNFQGANQTNRPFVKATQQETDYLTEHLFNTGLVTGIRQSKDQLYDDEGKPVNGFFDPNTGEVFLSPSIDINTVGHEGGHAVYWSIKRSDPKHEIVEYIDKQKEILEREHGLKEDADFWNAVGDLYYKRVMPKNLQQKIASIMGEFWRKAKGALGVQSVRERMIEGVVNRMVNAQGQWIPPKHPVQNVFREAIDSVFGFNVIPDDVVQRAKQVATELGKHKKKEKWTETERRGLDLIRNEKEFNDAWYRFTHGLALSPHEQYAVHKVMGKKLIEDLKIIHERGGGEFTAYLKDMITFARDTSYEAQSSIAGRSLAYQKTNISLIEALMSLEKMKNAMLPLEYQSVKKTILDIVGNPYYSDYEKIEKMEELATKYKKIYEKEPNIYDAAFSFMINNLLSGISTQVVNITSNAFHIPLLVFDRFSQATIDSMMTTNLRNRRVFHSEALEMFKSIGTLRGTRRGLQSIKEVWKHGKIVTATDFDSFVPYVFSNYRDEIIHSTYLSIQRYLEKKGIKQDTAAWVDKNLTAASRVLIGMDVFFKSIAAEAEMRARVKNFAVRNKRPEVWKSFITQQAKGGSAAQFIQEIGKENWKDIRQKAVKFADRATFQDAPPRAIKKFIEFRDSVPGARYFAPFVNTLNNIMVRALERTPGSAAFTLPRNIVRERNLDAEKIGPLQAAKARRDLQIERLDIAGKQIQGTVIAMMILSMFDDDKLTGPPPKDNKEREMFYGAGKIPYAIKVGGKWVSYRNFEPLSTALGIMAGFRDALLRADEKGDETNGTEIFMDMASTVDSVIINSTWMRSVVDLSRSENLIEKMAMIPSNFVPYSSFSRQMNKAVEVWTTGESGINDKRGKSLPEITGESVVENLPLGTFLYERLGGNLEKRITVWGKKIDVSNDVPMKWLMGGFSEMAGIDIRDVLDDDFEMEMIDLGVYPSMPDKTVTLKKREIEIPDETYMEWMLVRGQFIKNVMEKVISSPSYRRVTDPEARKEVLQKALNKTQGGLNKLLLSKMTEEIREEFSQ